MTTLNGIDVSAWQGSPFPWSKYKGIAFAGVKISEGLTFADPDAKANIAGVRSIGAVPIGYHLVHAGLSGSGQAEWFLSCAEKAGIGQPRDLMAADCEDAGLDGESPSQMNLTAAGFVGQVRRHTRYAQYWPLAYTEQSMAPHLTSLGQCPLWIADLTVPLITGVGPWSLVSFYQVSQRGVDCDVFNGDATALAKLGIK